MSNKEDVTNINGDISNATMSHTSNDISNTDFIIRDLDLNQEPEMPRQSKNFWQDAWSQLKRNKLAVIGMIGLLLIVIMAFIGPLMNKHDFAEQNVDHRNLPAKIPLLDHVSFLPFDGKGTDGKNAYKEVQAVRGVDFHLNKGETLAIVGESGSGKSVTTKAITKLFQKDTGRIKKGEILFLGEDLAQKSEKELIQLRGRDISMIFQDPMTSLNPTMQIGKQVMEPLIKHKKLSKAKAKQRALEILNLVGLPRAEKRFKAYPHQFSGGQRQRIVIAIALACEPKILIADEPTTALDVTMQAQILDLMKELQNKIETSIIFITHDLGVVANIADKVAVMYGGQMVETGDVNEIFYDPKHPYTWGLLSSMPDLTTSNDTDLIAIPGTPPDLLHPPIGDAFARRSRYALDIDFKEEPPWFKISPTHFVKSWLLDARAPKVTPPSMVQKRLRTMPSNYEQPHRVERVAFNE